ncbi:TPA: hypothetical protein ACOEAW_000290 [Enterobacter hormaechei subsp. xiangfangensis]|nr:hypothetical protein [Enterobacter hormaechei subsp. xiangfangensis]
MTPNKYAALRATIARAKRHDCQKVVMRVTLAEELLDQLSNAEKRIAELQNDEVRQRLANAEHQLHMAELAKHNMRASRKAQFRKRKAAEKRIAEMQALASGVKQFSEFQICHYGATEDYAKGYIDCQNNYNKVLFAEASKGEAL